MCRNLTKNRLGFKLEKLYHHHYFAPGVRILFLKPSDSPARLGQPVFAAYSVIFHDLVHPTFANLWLLCFITVLLLFFGIFLNHQLPSVVSLWTSFFIYSLDMPQPSQPLFSQKFFRISTPVISGILSLFILSFRAFSHIFYNILIL